MIPLRLFRARAPLITTAFGFTFMVGFYGMVFLMSLFLQEQRGLTPLETGLAFLPVTGFSIFMPIVAARMAERFGPWAPIVLGQAAMAAGLLALGSFAEGASTPALIAMMIPVGFGGGTAMPSTTSLLLNTLPRAWSGTAGGVLNTSRQVGGATAIAAFGALITRLGYGVGMQVSLLVAGGLLLVTLCASFSLRGLGQAHVKHEE